MPTVWPDSSVVREHAHPERVLGLSPGRVMVAGGGVNYTREEKSYEQTGTRTQDLSRANTLTT